MDTTLSSSVDEDPAAPQSPVDESTNPGMNDGGHDSGENETDTDEDGHVADDTSDLIAELTASDDKAAPSLILRTVGRAKSLRALQSLVVLLALALVAVPAYAAYQNAQGQIPIYEAQLDVLYRVDRANFGETDLIMANARIVAEQRALRERVAEAVELDVQDLIDSSEVEQVESAGGANSSVLRFRVRSVNRDDTLVLLDRWVGIFLAEAVEEDPDEEERAEINATIEELQKQRDEARDAIEEAEELKANTRLDGLTNLRRTQVAAELDRDVAAAGARYDEIIRDINTHALLLARLEPEGAQVAIERLGDGFVAPDPVYPRPLRTLALGLAVGMVLAATYLFVISQLRTRSRIRSEHIP